MFLAEPAKSMARAFNRASEQPDPTAMTGPSETENPMMSDIERRVPPIALRTVPISAKAPALDDLTRRRLGRELRALYDPVIDEPLDPRLAELMQQLETDRGGSGT